MHGFSYGGGTNPQYPPPQPQNQMYNRGSAPPPQPGQPAPGYPVYGQNPQFPYQPGYPYQPQPGPATYPSQMAAAMAYPGVAPTVSSAPDFAYPNSMPTVSPQPTYASTVQWEATTVKDAHVFVNRAVVAGYEGHDKSPLWVIRSRFQNDLIPGKLAVKHQSAYVAWGGKENAVQNIEVCCAKPESIKWVPSSGGIIPLNAVLGGHTCNGEPLYIGRAKEQGSLTPGKVHPSHKVLYMSFSGYELPHQNYELLCTV